MKRSFFTSLLLFLKASQAPLADDASVIDYPDTIVSDFFVKKLIMSLIV